MATMLGAVILLAVFAAAGSSLYRAVTGRSIDVFNVFAASAIETLFLWGMVGGIALVAVLVAGLVLRAVLLVATL